MAGFSTPALTFNFSTQALRVIMRDGNPWFVASDVCAAIGIKNHRDSIERLDDDEKGVALTDTPGGAQEMLIINESGLNAIILRSRDAMTVGTPAHRYRKWVTSEVLPSIRKTGAYARDNQNYFQEHNQRVERVAQVTHAAKLFTATHKSLCGIGLSLAAHATRANQIVQQATGLDYLGMAGNPHLEENLELFERKPVPTPRRANLNPLGKLLACIANGKRYKANPNVRLDLGTEMDHSELLRHSRLKRDDFNALIEQAITQNKIARKYISGYSGTIYVLVQGAAA